MAEGSVHPCGRAVRLEERPVIGVNPSGIPAKCEGCGAVPREGETTIDVRIANFSEVSRDGDVVCAACGKYIRMLNT